MGFKNIHSSFFQIGSFKAKLDSPNFSWAQELTRSLKHLAISPCEHPDFSIRIWDSSGCKKNLPQLDWNLINQNGYRGYSHPPFYFHYFESIQTLSAINTEKNTAYFMARDSSSLPWWVSASPLQVIFHVFLKERGFQLTHTGAVGDDKKAVLLCGKGGSGKSTTTLSCLASGLRYLGEDYCILDVRQKEVYSIYQSAKWEMKTRKIFPDYENFIQNKDAAKNEKALVYYDNIFPLQIKINLPIMALVSLSVGAEHFPVLKKTDQKTALKNLMMSTLVQLPFSEPKTIKNLHLLVKSLPSYHLTLGSDLGGNVGLIKKILSGEVS